jgi:hypothetical protein
MTNVINPPLVNTGNQYGDANTSGRLGGYMTQAPLISGRSKTTTNEEEPTSGYDEQGEDGGDLPRRMVDQDICIDPIPSTWFELDPKSPDKCTTLAGLREGRCTTEDGSVGTDAGPGFTASQSYGRDNG